MASITAVIPTFRRPALLARAIESVLAQEYDDLEMIVSDNNSGDETEDVVRKYARRDARIKYICQPANIGVLGNFISALKCVRTEYFSVLSDDDLLLPGFYREAIKNLNAHPTARFFVGSTIQVTEAGAAFRAPLDSWADGLHSPPFGAASILENSLPIWTGILFRRECLVDGSFLNGDVGAFADFDCTIRLAMRFPFVVSKKPCALLVVHPGTVSENLRYSDVWPVLQNIGDIVFNSPELDEGLVRRIRPVWRSKVEGHLMNVVKIGLVTGKVREASLAIDEIERQFGSSIRTRCFKRLVWLSGLSPSICAAVGAVISQRRRREFSLSIARMAAHPAAYVGQQLSLPYGLKS